MLYPDSLLKLINFYKKQPGVGEKSAERMAFSVLGLEEEQVNFFRESLKEVKEKIRPCSICNALTDKEVCDICSSSLRQAKLCVVEDPKIVFLFEKLGTFRGKYHVLNGLISPLDGLNPEDIGLEKLIKRIEEEKIEEIILAFKPSIEGETTTLYIKRILEGMNVEVTQLASGVPMGADMEYVDALTLERALFDRKKVE